MSRFAQTYLQLHHQIRRLGYSKDDIEYCRRVYEFAMQVFSGYFQTNGKPYLSHVVGTASILVSLHASKHIVATALLHNVYNRGDFGDGKKRITPARRKKISRVVGSETESYLAAFHAMNWTQSLFPSIRDHLKEYNQVQRTVVLIHLADWLEHNLDNGTRYYPQSKSAWFRENYEIFLEMTAILHQPVLHTAYQQVQQENTAIDLSEGFQLSNTNT